MTTRFLAVLIPLATTWPVTAAHAQLADTVLQPGRTIRLVAPELGIRRGSGTLVDIRGDTLVLGVRGLIPEPGESFRLSLVEQLDVSIGRKSHAAYGRSSEPSWALSPGCSCSHRTARVP